MNVLKVQPEKDLQFIKKYQLNGMSIDEKVRHLPGVMRIQWEAGEFGATCKLFMKEKATHTIFFTRHNNNVYTSSRRTADLFPELPRTNLNGLSYDTFGGLPKK